MVINIYLLPFIYLFITIKEVRNKWLITNSNVIIMEINEQVDDIKLCINW